MKKRKLMIIGILLSVFILLGVIIYLHYTNRLNYLFNLKWGLFFESLKNFQKWILSASLIASLLFAFFTSFVSTFLYEKLFPSSEKKILTNTELIIENQNEIEVSVSELHSKSDELLKISKIDTRDIEKYLKELPLKNGKNEIENKINQWYNERKITLDEKELLLVIISVNIEQYESQSQEIKYFKSKEKPEVAEFLEKIQQYFKEGNAAKIKNEYFLRKENFKQENIIILKQSIKAAEALYSYGETRDLYKELIILEPSANNYFQFAYFLQKLNYFNEAANYYQEALKIYRELIKENPLAYLPNVAITLTNLANLFSAKNDFPQAFVKYKEALTIYRELTKENPSTYLPDLAMTLNNFSILQYYNNELLQSLVKHEEALKIYRELAKEDPRTYEIEYARMLVLGVDLFRKDKVDLKEAKRILEKYPNIYKAQKLLKLIKRLK